jgi:hypothetical protein
LGISVVAALVSWAQGYAAPSVGRVRMIADGSRAAALDLRVALDTIGSSRPGRPTETGRADRLSGHRAQPRGAAPDPGLPIESGQGRSCLRLIRDLT